MVCTKLSLLRGKLEGHFHSQRRFLSYVSNLYNYGICITRNMIFYLTTNSVSLLIDFILHSLCYSTARITSFSTNSTCLPLQITVSHPIIVVDLVKVIIRIATAVNGESKIIERKFKINATMKNTIIELKESDIDKDVKVFDMQLHFALADVMGHPSRNSDLITTTCNGEDMLNYGNCTCILMATVTAM